MSDPLKGKLARFSDFAAHILPLEAHFLLQSQRFEDEEKIAILHSIIDQAGNPEKKIQFDTSIDKRKYSYVKSWCEKILTNLDVDYNLEKILQWEHFIRTDSLSVADDRECRRVISQTEPSDFNFIKIYDVARVYRHYLQIRLRHKDYVLIHNFLNRHRTDYEFSRLVNDKLHEATSEIISDYAYKKNMDYDESIRWLSSLFYNENLDGYNRILAWIRLVFIAHNTRRYELLTDMFTLFEKLVTSGRLYSRRIVTNFYSQYLLYYASMQQFDKAVTCGYYSIKEKNNDHLYYVNNLAAMLLRSKRPDEALIILKDAATRAKVTPNMHNKIGHTAYKVFALTDTGKSALAENQAFVFLTAYKKEIIEHRWHLFFTAYLKAMLTNKNYTGVLKTASNFRLLHRDDQNKTSIIYSPSIPWMILLASFKNGDLTIADLKSRLNELMHINREYVNSAITHQDLLTLTKIVLNKDFQKLGMVDT